MINGKTEGIKQNILDELELLYEAQCPRGEFLTQELADALAKYSCMLNREISIFLSRSGHVLDISIGSEDNVSLPVMRKRRGTMGLSGVRCIHTHPGGSSHLSDVDVGTLLSARMDCMAALAVADGVPKSLCAGFIGESLGEAVFAGPFFIRRLPNRFLMEEIERATRRVADLVRTQATEEETERAILVGLNCTQAEMDELALLAQTAGAESVAQFTQDRPRERGLYIGQGKVKEIALTASALEADLAIFNDELSAVEARNLEEQLGIKIVDRTTLILDIFARRAKTREGRLQVELAQLKYNLPRLMGEGLALSRLGAGIGTRGPGESKLEMDRRRIRRRIYELEGEIEKLALQRSLRREQREKNNVPEIALVGYTNAGKSSLLNAVSDAGVYAEDKLFATLDPVTRKVQMPSGKEMLFTDTVGFIHKLPHDLVSAFRSTLEEANRAGLLLIVTDLSNPEAEKQSQVVREVLEELGAGDKPAFRVYNKADLVQDVPENTRSAFCISAKTGQGIPELLAAVEARLQPKMAEVSLKLGYQEGAKLAQLQKYAEKIQVEYEEDGMSVWATLPEIWAKRILNP